MKSNFNLNFHIVFLFCIAVLLNVSSFPLSAKDIYVSVIGDDSNSGEKGSPLATLSKAKELAYSRIEGGDEEEITIWLSEGTYRIERPVIFEPIKVKTKNSGIVFKAMPNEKTIISGGKRITGWKKNKSGLWETKLPRVFENQNPRELFIDHQRATRARFPNQNYLRVKQVGADRRTHFFFNDGDFPIPENIDGVELVLLHDWSISRIAIKEINSLENKLTAVDSIGAKSPDFFNLDHWEPNPRYYLENAPEFLDENYEWIYIPNKNKILLKLPDTQNPEFMNIEVPFSKGLISIFGNENTPVENIHFEGITFCFSSWEIPKMGYCGVQACHFDSRPKDSGWSVVPAAIKAIWAKNCSFNKCYFENLGGSGVWLGTGSKFCTIKNSGFFDISGNGIMIGEGRDRKINGESWWKVSPEQVATRNTVKNCIVTNCGKQFYGAVGIWCGLTAESNVTNNEIYDLSYTGVSIGWMWSPEPTPCRENVVDGNHIHHIMKILSDGGGIYMLGLQPGSRLVNNNIHDVTINAGRAESNGMFLDEGTTDVLVANNLIYNIAKSPLRFHRATTNLVQDNYLFCTGDNPPIRYNTTNEEDIKKVNNKIFLEGDAAYLSELKKAIEAWK